MSVPRGRHVRTLDLDAIPRGRLECLWVHIVNNRLGEPIRVPVVVVRGAHEGPVFGLTAAIHGNELNGIPIIQHLAHELDPARLRGTVVGALVLNVPGLLLEQRVFNDGQDLNRLAPGNPHGTVSEIYIHRIIERIISCFDYHVDLHTASFGRVNSHYVRADMDDPITARMARLQSSDIIVHNAPSPTNLRGAASRRGIHSITVELRDPHVFQDAVVEDGLLGARNLLVDLGMLEGSLACPLEETILCRSSEWSYTDEGGILHVGPQVLQTLAEGEPMAEVRTIFGDVIKRYYAPAAGIVVGKSVNPLNQTGSRIVHLGHEPTAIPCITAEDGAPLRG